MELSLPAIIAVASLFVTFVVYVSAVQYRLGKVETQVDSNKDQITSLQRTMASKSDIDGVNSRLDKIDANITKLFDIERENRNARTL